MIKSFSSFTLIVFAVFSLAACASVRTIPLTEENSYKLGIGDKVRVNVYNQDKLSGDFTVESTGNISLPLVESIPAAGLTTAQLEENVKQALQPEYLNDPKVSIEILNYRNVYILGEVEEPGKYEYVPNMTLLQAVATANGYTPRASEGGATVTRHVKGALILFDIEETTMLKPGDTVVINRRWF